MRSNFANSIPIQSKIIPLLLVRFRTFGSSLGYKIHNMVNVLTEIIINRPKEVVSTFVSDPDNATKWYVNIKSAECLPAGQAGKTPKPLRVGSLVTFTAHFLGKKLAYTYEFTELIPGEKLVMRTAEGPFPMETTYTWETVNGNMTRMTLRNKGNPTGFSKLFVPFMKMAMKRANQKDLILLKKILENNS